MTDCPSWCATPDTEDDHVHEALWNLQGLPVLVSRMDGPPLLELNANPADATAVSMFVMDALTHLRAGATLVITVQPNDG